MWNPFRRFAESDAHRLRELETRLDELCDEFEKVEYRLRRMDARSRRRSTRELADPVEPVEADYAVASPAPAGVGRVSGNGVDRTATREQLRQLWRQRQGGG